MKIKPKIIVICHDGGASNILASLIKKYRHEFDWLTFAFGPAKNIFILHKLPLQVPLIYSSNNKIDHFIQSLKPDLILTGTGKIFSWERIFIKAAKRNNIKTASLIDHWVNYRERFGYPGDWKKNLPDYIFIVDKWAYKIAVKNGFPKNILLFIENPYIEEIIGQANKIRQKKNLNNQSNKVNLLYISEKTGQQDTEYKILKDLLKIIKKQSTIELKIRLHPAEDAGKYFNLLKRKDFLKISELISISNPVENLLVKDCLWSDLVVGFNSMALLIALLVGKKVIAYLPNKKQTFALPAKEIVKVHSLTELEDQIKFAKDNQIKPEMNFNFSSRKNFKNVFYKKIVILQDG